MGAVRDLADRYTEAYLALDPNVATMIGMPGHDDELTDYSLEGWQEREALARRTLAELDGLESDPDGDDADRRCARLLRERLGAEQRIVDLREPGRLLNNMGSPAQDLKQVFEVMPTATPEQLEVLATRMEALPVAYAQYRSGLDSGVARGEMAALRQVTTVVEQLTVWSGGREVPAFFPDLVARVGGRAGDALRQRLEAGAQVATLALEDFRDYLARDYAPKSEGTPDAVGPERYAAFARLFNGIDLDLADAYAYGWDELGRIDAEMQAEADRVLSGASPREAMAHLDSEGPAIESEVVLREWLSGLVLEAMTLLDGPQFDLAPEVRRVEARIAPPGGASAPYYTPPSQDFSRPGITWYPTQGKTRFPLWEHVSTWYHEGVPGHHLQLAQWVLLAKELSRYQATLGMVSANLEGWALYAERLMDELGFYADPGRRLGFLVGQQLRAVRVVIDIGMHLELEIPEGQPFHPGERWTPELGRELLLAHAGTDVGFLDSELVRYLGMPGQAIGYKLGERVWLAGREEARRRRGAEFDLKAWHMAALSQGSLGLDDLADELAAL
jgi:uncharacterized protein (DUF885 family)